MGTGKDNQPSPGLQEMEETNSIPKLGVLGQVKLVQREGTLRSGSSPAHSTRRTELFQMNRVKCDG